LTIPSGCETDLHESTFVQCNTLKPVKATVKLEIIGTVIQILWQCLTKLHNWTYSII